MTERVYNMIKSDLMKKIAEENPHLYYRDIEKIINLILNKIVLALENGQRVELRGFGYCTITPTDPVKVLPLETIKSVASAIKYPPDAAVSPNTETLGFILDNLDKDSYIASAPTTEPPGLLIWTITAFTFSFDFKRDKRLLK